MIKRNFLYILVFAIMVVSNIVLIIRDITLRKYYSKEIATYVKENEDNKKLLLRDMYLLSQEIAIDSNLINDILQKKSLRYLIFAYTSDECNKCIVEDIALLKRKISNRNMKNVIVLPVFENSRNINISLKADLEGINYKRIDKGYVKFPCRGDGSSVRFFAILTSQGKLILPFFPETSHPKRTNDYLEFVFLKYFSN